MFVPLLTAKKTTTKRLKAGSQRIVVKGRVLKDSQLLRAIAPNGSKVYLFERVHFVRARPRVTFC